MMNPVLYIPLSDFLRPRHKTSTQSYEEIPLTDMLIPILLSN